MISYTQLYFAQRELERREMGYRTYDGTYIDYEDTPHDGGVNRYAVWREPDGSVYHWTDMPECCKDELEAAGRHDAELECRKCGEYWKAVG